MIMFFTCLFFEGSQAAGAAGCQHAGRENGEQDADSGERPWHGQHHVPELHGLPGGDGEGNENLWQEEEHGEAAAGMIGLAPSCTLGHVTVKSV